MRFADQILSGEPQGGRAAHSVAGVSAAVVVWTLVMVTGGEGSPFEFLLVPVLLHAALACGRSLLLVEGSLLLLLTSTPLVFGRGASPVGVLGDLVEIVVWMGVAAFVASMRDRLRRNEERYRSLFDKHPDSVSSRDRWGNIERMNPAASTLVGMDPDALAERDWTEFVPPGRLAEIESHYVAALKGRASSFETQLFHAEGHRIDVAITFIPIVVDGAVTGVYHISQDISQRVQAQSSLALFQRVVDQISDGVLIWGRDDDAIRYINPAAASILGVPRAEMDALNPSDLTDEWEPTRLQERVDELAGSTDDGIRIAFDVEQLDGTTVPVESATQMVSAPDGESVFVAVLRDVSAHRETQEALQSALEAQQASTERLRAVNEMQQTFLQAVSHELRTPLTSITGYAQTLQGHWSELPAEKVTHMLERLSLNSKRLAAMLQDLLDVDRLSRGTIQLALTRTDLGGLCREVVDQIDLRGRPVRVRSDDDVEIHADRPKVERIVENLVYNAIKHTPQGTTISVRVDACDDGGVMTIEDNGPGVRPELREAIFEPFRQGPASASAASPGTGIGLALVAKFSRLHGGRAWAEEAPDGGAAFKVFLPYEPPADVMQELGIVTRLA